LDAFATLSSLVRQQACGAKFEAGVLAGSKTAAATGFETGSHGLLLFALQLVLEVLELVDETN
jgi:hypothetical protein